MKQMRKLSPVEAKAKMNTLEKVKQQMMDMMGEKVSGLKKVTVASDSSEGLEKGLKKAKEMIHGGNAPDSYLPGQENEADDASEGSEDEELEHEASSTDTPEMEQAERSMDSIDGEDTHEDIDKKIQELLKKKASLSK